MNEVNEVSNMISGSESGILVPTAPSPGSTAAPAPTLMSTVDIIKEESSAVSTKTPEPTIAPPPPETEPTPSSATIAVTGTPTSAIQPPPPPPPDDAQPGEVGVTPPSGTVTTGNVVDNPTELTGSDETTASAFQPTPITEGTDTSGLNDDIGDNGAVGGKDGPLPPPPEDDDKGEDSDGILPKMEGKDVGMIFAGVSAGLIMLGSFIYFFVRSQKKKK